jgi:N-acetylmuramoyl-L-alanine amidase
LIFGLSVTLFNSLVYASVNRKFSVLIDPGHGGSDRGASVKNGNNVINESSLTLKLSQKIILLINKNYSDVIEVSTTRDLKKYVSLQKRAEINIEQKNDLFVSLHYNSSFSGSVSGTEIYFPAQAEKKDSSSETILDYIKNDLNETGRIKKSLSFAKIIPAFLNSTHQQDLTRTKIRIRRAPFYVLENTNSAALLIEVGYLTNESDQAAILSAHHQNQTAESIVKAIVQFKEMSDKPAN